MRMQFIYCSNNLFIFLLILLTNSINVESKCTRFDDLAIAETDDKLIGQWNLLYSTVSGDILSSLTFLKKDGNQLEFEQKTIDGQKESGHIKDMNLKRKTFSVGFFHSTFWIIKSDFNNYLLVYQCTKQKPSNRQNDFYRILSKSNVISESDLSELLKTLKEISPDISISKVNQSSSQYVDKSLFESLSDSGNDDPFDEQPISTTKQSVVESPVADHSSGDPTKSLSKLKAVETVSEAKNTSDESQASTENQDSQESQDVQGRQHYPESHESHLRKTAVKKSNGKQNDTEEECLTEDGKQFIAGCSLKDCPFVSYLPLTYDEFDKLEGSWYLQYSSKPVNYELNIEIEKTDSKTPVLKRYIIVRNGTEVTSLGITELFETRGFMKMHIMSWNQSCNIPQMEYYNIILSTDFTSYFIGIKVAPNVTWEQQIWTRAKQPGQSIVQPIVDEVEGLAMRNNLNVTLEPVSQNMTENIIAAEQLTCKDLSDKGIQNINVSRLRGNWRSILLNVESVKCLALRNRDHYNDSNDSNEFLFDVFTEKGNVGNGRIKSYGKNNLTLYSSVLRQERNITILDTDYINFFIYYKCNIVEVKGKPNKIVEFGLMAKNPVVAENIMTNARQVFNQNGLSFYDEVDQKNCHFKKQPPVVRTKYCDSVRNYTVNNFDLDLLSGRWWLKYSTRKNFSDVWTEWERNPDFTSDYTHIFQQISDDRVLKMLSRLDQSTGYLMVKIKGSEELPEIPYKFLTFTPDQNYILYLCDDMGIRTPVLEKLGIYSKNCEMDNVVKDRASDVTLSVGLFNQMNRIDQYNCEQDYKYMTKLLSKKCIKFHDSELVEPKLDLMAGRWNRHLMSFVLPFTYDYEMVVHRKDSLDFTAFPNQFQCRKSLLNGTNLLKTTALTPEYMVLGNEAIISVDYNSYILKYICVQYEQYNRFNVKELLMLSLRPETSSQLPQNPNLFVDIINKIPDKTLPKLQPLIKHLNDPTNDLYKDFGPKTTDMIEKRLNKFRADNNLSNRTDKEMFDYLRRNCDHFDEDEQIFFHLSTITSSNFSLDMTSYMDEKLSFDRTIITKESPFSYEVSFFKGDKFVVNSDRYYEKNSQTIWGYVEGRRSIRTYLFSDLDYRVVYVCEEHGLTSKRILRLHSTENTTKPRDWYSYLEIIISNLKPKTLAKVADLIEDLYPIGGSITSKENLKNTFKTFSTQINTFRLTLRGKSKSAQPDDEVNKFLIDNCKNFETDEIIDPNLSRLSGQWNIDWTSSLLDNQTEDRGLNFIDIIEQNSEGFALNTYLETSRRLPPMEVSKTDFVKIKNKKIFQRSSNGSTRGLMTIVWTDYDNYLIGFDCIENEVNGVLAVNEMLTFYSRNGTQKPTDLWKYFDIIGKQLNQKTILKLYHLMSSLLPSNPHFVNENLKPVAEYLSYQNLTEIQFEERIKFINNLYFEFLPKGLITWKINKYVTGQYSSSTTTNSMTEQNANKMFAKVTKVCDRFDDNELKNATKNIQKSLGAWSVDFETRNKFSNKFDSFEIGPDIKSNAFSWKYFLKNDLVLTKDSVVFNKWFQSRHSTGQRQLLVPLLLDSNHIITYMCEEVVFNDVSTGREFIHFASRKTNKTDLEEYLNKLKAILKPNTLLKVIDLISNIRPLDGRNKHISQSRANNRTPVLSESVFIESILQKHCKYFSPRDTVEPNFRKLLGNYKVRLAATNDFYKPFDTIEWVDGDDRFFSKLRLGTKFQCKGKLRRIGETNQFEEDFHKRRAIQTILYTDYSEVVVIYSCKENVHDFNRPVIENLKFLVRNNTNKVYYDIIDFRSLMFTKLSPNVYQSISGFIPNLKYMYNATNVLVNAVKPEEECPNLNNFAQKDIDFKRLTGHWNAIFTSNKRWDKDCISNDDSYDKSTDSLVQTKMISDKKHKVVIQHSDINGKQKIVVENTQFDSWILATDYDTYKLSYTCYVRQVKGIKKKIDLMRLYTKNIEAIDFDKKLLEILIKKAEVIGKQLEPINRSGCHIAKPSPGTVKVDQPLTSSNPDKAD